VRRSRPLETARAGRRLSRTTGIRPGDIVRIHDGHFTPTGASWINLVERWFAELTSRKLRRGKHRSVAELNADIEDWVEHWNENPNPYVWTKIADQILDTLHDGRVLARAPSRSNHTRRASGRASGPAAEAVCELWPTRTRPR
jgi:hypothetical protein